MKELKFELEDWFDCKEEMKWLFPYHWEEVALYKEEIPLEMWYEKYDLGAKAKEFYVITVRDDDKIVGYYWFMVRPHLHYKSCLTAYTDMFYIHPKYRKGFAAIKLFNKFAEEAKKLGAKRLIASCKTSLDLSKIFERMNWDKTEFVFQKLIK